MTDNPALDRHRFDAIVSGNQKLWGLRNIACALGVSENTARKWAEHEDVPIYKPSGTGKYFAFRGELVEWLRSR